jgi:hypothetical protein
MMMTNGSGTNWSQAIAQTVLLALVAGAASAQTGAPAASTSYTWHAELVSHDTAKRTVTVKVAAVDPAVGEGLKKHRAGDRVLIHWSGIHAAAHGVRDVRAFDAALASKDEFMLPATLAAGQLENNYVTIALAVPASAESGLKSVTPGAWITLTSPHRPGAQADAVMSVRPYVMAPATS